MEYNTISIPTNHHHHQEEITMPEIYFNPSFLSKGTHKLYYKFAVVIDDGTCFCAIKSVTGGKIKGQSFKEFNKASHVGLDAIDLMRNCDLVKTHRNYSDEMVKVLDFMATNFNEIISNCDFKDRHFIAVGAVRRLLDDERYISMIGERPGNNAGISEPAVPAETDSSERGNRIEMEKEDLVYFIAEYNGDNGKYFGMEKGKCYPITLVSTQFATLITEGGPSVVPLKEIDLCRIAL